MTKKTKRMSTKEREAMRLAKHILNLEVHAVKRFGQVLDRIEKRESARRYLKSMRSILDTIRWPEGVSTVGQKADYIGITRQTWYDWMKGKFRPNIQQAKKLSELTGLTVKQIRGTE